MHVTLCLWFALMGEGQTDLVDVVIKYGYFELGNIWTLNGSNELWFRPHSCLVYNSWNLILNCPGEWIVILSVKNLQLLCRLLSTFWRHPKPLVPNPCPELIRELLYSPGQPELVKVQGAQKCLQEINFGIWEVISLGFIFGQIEC